MQLAKQILDTEQDLISFPSISLSRQDSPSLYQNFKDVMNRNRNRIPNSQLNSNVNHPSHFNPSSGLRHGPGSNLNANTYRNASPGSNLNTYRNFSHSPSPNANLNTDQYSNSSFGSTINSNANHTSRSIPNRNIDFNHDRKFEKDSPSASSPAFSPPKTLWSQSMKSHAKPSPSALPPPLDPSISPPPLPLSASPPPLPPSRSPSRLDHGKPSSLFRPYSSMNREFNFLKSSEELHHHSHQDHYHPAAGLFQERFELKKQPYEQDFCDSISQNDGHELLTYGHLSQTNMNKFELNAFPRNIREHIHLTQQEKGKELEQKELVKGPPNKRGRPPGSRNRKMQEDQGKIKNKPPEKEKEKNDKQLESESDSESEKERFKIKKKKKREEKSKLSKERLKEKMSHSKQNKSKSKRKGDKKVSDQQSFKKKKRVQTDSESSGSDTEDDINSDSCSSSESDIDTDRTVTDIVEIKSEPDSDTEFRIELEAENSKRQHQKTNSSSNPLSLLHHHFSNEPNLPRNNWIPGDDFILSNSITSISTSKADFSLPILDNQDTSPQNPLSPFNFDHILSSIATSPSQPNASINSNTQDLNAHILYTTATSTNANIGAINTANNVNTNANGNNINPSLPTSLYYELPNQLDIFPSPTPSLTLSQPENIHPLEPLPHNSTQNNHIIMTNLPSPLNPNSQFVWIDDSVKIPKLANGSKHNMKSIPLPFRPLLPSPPTSQSPNPKESKPKGSKRTTSKAKAIKSKGSKPTTSKAKVVKPQISKSQPSMSQISMSQISMSQPSMVQPFHSNQPLPEKSLLQYAPPPHVQSQQQPQASSNYLVHDSPLVVVQPLVVHSSDFSQSSVILRPIDIIPNPHQQQSSMFSHSSVITTPTLQTPVHISETEFQFLNATELRK